MEENILITYFNDYIYCPLSIYYHRLYDRKEKNIYTGAKQIQGTNAHKSIDQQKYTTSKKILQGISVYSSKYKITGKIDMYNIETKTLTEKKNKIVKIYDGYIYQLYAQYYCLIEMGYKVDKIKLYSISDNKNYDVKLPEDDSYQKEKFFQVLESVRNFNPKNLIEQNIEKCKNCIYSNLCIYGGEVC